ncbi:hypothetical protein Pan5_23 [Pseudanabaena phage Pan5]|nr:hypothetical protein Pan5_23 [Pseudanabaena phage Pan5]
MFDFLFSTWIGGMLLGGYIVGLLLKLDEREITTKKNSSDILEDIGFAMVWFLEKGFLFIKWILGLIRRLFSLFALLALPALAMADDGKFWNFMDYKFLPFLGVLIGLLPLLILRQLIRKAQGKIPNIYYDENGEKHVETFKRPINRGGLIFYIIAQIGLGFIAYKMLIHHL